MNVVLPWQSGPKQAEAGPRASRIGPRGRACPLRHPLSRRIERDTLAWMAGFGIGEDAAEAEKLRRFDCAKYGGCSLPTADREAATLVTQYIALWLFWDDMQVESDQAWDVEEVVAALTSGEALAGASCYVAAWADLGLRLHRARSRAWCEHLGASMRQWLHSKW